MTGDLVFFWRSSSVMRSTILLFARSVFRPLQLKVECRELHVGQQAFRNRWRDGFEVFQGGLILSLRVLDFGELKACIG